MRGKLSGFEAKNLIAFVQFFSWIKRPLDENFFNEWESAILPFLSSMDFHELTSVFDSYRYSSRSPSENLLKVLTNRSGELLQRDRYDKEQLRTNEVRQNPTQSTNLGIKSRVLGSCK